MAESKAFRCYASEAILKEYKEVLTRENIGLKRYQITGFMRMMRKTLIIVSPRKEMRAASDPDDDMFLECAIEARADYVVTGNLRHFPAQFQDVRILSPRQFLTILAAQPS